jgi:arabinogalactan oligomer / maltooligosaccharide transport system permease protein
LNSNIADLRRAIPYETMTLFPYKAFLSLFIPGFGQFLNKQYEKAGLFVFATLFIYLAAIPYALGFGNYQGTGISGLMSLAQGARRVDRSLIFLIEGLVAIFLVIISIVLLILNFKDVRATEKAAIKGERPKKLV